MIWTKRQLEMICVGAPMVILLMTFGCTSDGRIAMPGAFNGIRDTTKRTPQKMIDVYGMTLAEARAALAEHNIGNQLDTDADDGYCAVERRVQGKVVDIIDKGRICHQRPSEGQDIDSRTRLRVAVVKKDPWHGSIGTNMEWHRMPKVVGMPLEEAMRTMEKAGFTNKDTISIKKEYHQDCKAGVVCACYPDELNTVAQTSGKYLVVGVEG